MKLRDSYGDLVEVEADGMYGRVHLRVYAEGNGESGCEVAIFNTPEEVQALRKALKRAMKIAAREGVGR